VVRPELGDDGAELEEFRGGFEAAMATWAAEHPRAPKVG
jgi:hypothetical protein